MTPLERLALFAEDPENHPFDADSAQELLDFLQKPGVLLAERLREKVPQELLADDELLPERDNVEVLDDYRIKSSAELQDDPVAWYEVIWGAKSWGFNLAIKDLEDLRRGGNGGSLRQPETYHELVHLVLHIRASANDVARHFRIEELVREEDDLGE